MIFGMRAGFYCVTIRAHFFIHTVNSCLETMALQLRDQKSAPYRFKKYSTDMFKPGSIAVYIARKGSGKTSGMLDQCYNLRDCPEVWLFQRTYFTNKSFWGIVPELFCYNQWRPDVIRYIMRRQDTINKKRMKNDLPPRYCTIIVDDLAGDKTFTKDKILNELFYNARHLKINVLITMQYSLNITPDLRSQFDWVFMFQEAMPRNLRRLYEHYCGHFGEGREGFNEFKKIFGAMTEKYGFMAFHNTASTGKIEDMYFFGKAKLRDFHEFPDVKKWRMGSKQQWRFNARHFDPHWDSDDNENSDSDSNNLVIERG